MRPNDTYTQRSDRRAPIEHWSAYLEEIKRSMIILLSSADINIETRLRFLKELRNSATLRSCESASLSP